MRGLLSEYGIIVARGVQRLRTSLPTLLEDADNAQTFASRELFQDLYQQLVRLDERIEDIRCGTSNEHLRPGD